MGRWSPCIGDSIPSRSPEGRVPKLAFDAILLEGDAEHYTLDEAIKKWPAPIDLTSEGPAALSTIPVIKPDNLSGDTVEIPENKKESINVSGKPENTKPIPD